MNTRQLRRNAETGPDGSSPEQNVGIEERWLSAALGALVSLAGLRRGGLGGALLGGLGGMLLYRGASGHCALYERAGYNTAVADDGQPLSAPALHLGTSILIDRPAEDLYEAWRDFESLPRFMRHIVEVKTHDARRSHWIARTPLGQYVEWDAELIEDIPNEYLEWQSTGDSEVQQRGVIRFRRMGDLTTELRVDIDYLPRGGAVGALFARFINGLTRQELKSDVRRFKQLMETGEVATAEIR